MDQKVVIYPLRVCHLQELGDEACRPLVDRAARVGADEVALLKIHQVLGDYHFHESAPADDILRFGELLKTGWEICGEFQTRRVSPGADELEE